MKKLMTAVGAVTVALALATTAFANGSVTVGNAYIGGTNIMVVPPAISFGATLGQIPVRTAGETVGVGTFRRQGNDVLVAANGGAISSETTTNVTSYTVLSNVTSSVISTNTVSTTNVIAKVVTIPASGLTSVDGAVYWFKVMPKRQALAVSVALGGGTVFLSTAPDGTGLPVTTATNFGAEFWGGYQGALFATKSTTNAVTVTGLEFPLITP